MWLGLLDGSPGPRTVLVSPSAPERQHLPACSLSCRVTCLPPAYHWVQEECPCFSAEPIDSQGGYQEHELGLQQSEPHLAKVSPSSLMSTSTWAQGWMWKDTAICLCVLTARQAAGLERPLTHGDPAKCRGHTRQGLGK